MPGTDLARESVRAEEPSIMTIDLVPTAEQQQAER
jgi:hypothetical protein